MDLDGIFSAYKGYRGVKPSGLAIDWIGFRIQDSWDLNKDPAEFAEYTPSPPDRNNEIFEWIDILRAVDEARDRFTMLELGAGFGRWGFRAGLAAKQRNLPCHLIFAEPEPQHVEWIKAAAKLNGFGPHEITVLDKALGYTRSQIPFIIGQIGKDEFDASAWYGQAVGWEGSDLRRTDTSYFGKPVFIGDVGYSQIFVDCASFEEMIDQLEHVDIVDVDIQKAELDLVCNSMVSLTDRVSRVHIATHEPEIEVVVRERFTSAGWRLIWDFPCRTVSDTPYGPIAFDDGVQGWVNPNFRQQP